jgi:hypothetical protein
MLICNLQLVQILRATDDAFSEAADVIIPFIRPESQESHTTVFSIARFPDEFYQKSPMKMLDLLVAVVGDAPDGSVYALNEALSRLREVSPELANQRRFQKLQIAASPSL